TPLDAHYLDQCLLLRAAANSLELKDRSPLEQAKAAFAWVMRQVRLQESEGVLLPSQFILRRGWGTAEERALIFLAMLDQLRIPSGMLAFKPEEQGKATWR